MIKVDLRKRSVKAPWVGISSSAVEPGSIFRPLLLALLLLLVVGCQRGQPAPVPESTPPPTVQTMADEPVAAPPVAEMPPEEALLLALECEGNLVSNTIEYTFREGMQAGFANPEAAFAGYKPLSELPLDAPAFSAADDQLVVRVYGAEGRYTGKAAARLGPDGSWVVTSIVRCLEPPAG